MKQMFIHVQAEEYEDLACEIQNRIEEQHDDRYYLVNIEYLCTDTDDGFLHAFLLFNEFKKVWGDFCG